MEELGVCASRVLLMPEGTTTARIDEVATWLVPAVLPSEFRGQTAIGLRADGSARCAPEQVEGGRLRAKGRNPPFPSAPRSTASAPLTSIISKSLPELN